MDKQLGAIRIVEVSPARAQEEMRMCSWGLEGTGSVLHGSRKHSEMVPWSYVESKTCNSYRIPKNKKVSKVWPGLALLLRAKCKRKEINWRMNW